MILILFFQLMHKPGMKTLYFLDKKSSMKKLQLENNKNYSLKSTFKNGYVC